MISRSVSTVEAGPPGRPDHGRPGRPARPGGRHRHTAVRAGARLPASAIYALAALEPKQRTLLRQAYVDGLANVFVERWCADSGV